MNLVKLLTEIATTLDIILCLGSQEIKAIGFFFEIMTVQQQMLSGHTNSKTTTYVAIIKSIRSVKTKLSNFHFGTYGIYNFDEKGSLTELGHPRTEI